MISNRIKSWMSSISTLPVFERGIYLKYKHSCAKNYNVTDELKMKKRIPPHKGVPSAASHYQPDWTAAEARSTTASCHHVSNSVCGSPSE